MSTRNGAIARLAGLAVALTAFLAVFALGGIVGAGNVRSWIEPAGFAAPLLYLVLAGVLGALLVPGAALSAAAGLLFGPVAGALISLPSAVLSAVLAQRFSRTAGAAAFAEVASPRLLALTSFARRHGLRAVIIQRLLPAVPDGPLSHAFGLAGVTTAEIALGTLIASGPRAFSYALLGSSVDDLTGPNAIAGIILNVGTGALGVGLAWLVIRQERRRVRASALAADQVRAGTMPSTETPRAGKPPASVDPVGEASGAETPPDGEPAARSGPAGVAPSAETPAPRPAPAEAEMPRRT